MSIPVRTATRFGHAVEDLMSSLHPSSLPVKGGDGVVFALPSVRSDASLSEAAAQFLLTGATILAVTDPLTKKQIGLLLRRLIHPGG
jgi:hypothetical protein